MLTSMLLMNNKKNSNELPSSALDNYLPEQLHMGSSHSSMSTSKLTKNLRKTPKETKSKKHESSSKSTLDNTKNNKHEYDLDCRYQDNDKDNELKFFSDEGSNLKEVDFSLKNHLIKSKLNSKNLTKLKTSSSMENQRDFINNQVIKIKNTHVDIQMESKTTSKLPPINQSNHSSQSPYRTLLRTTERNFFKNDQLATSIINTGASFGYSSSHFNSQHFDSNMGSSTTLSNNRTKPKTSKEILQEIARLTNGTTPSFKPSVSDLETSFSSNSRTILNHHNQKKY